MSTLAAERPSRPALPKLFAALVLLVYGIELVAVRGSRGASSDVIALAATIDLTIFVPSLYWLLVVRPSGASPWRVVAALAASLLGARLVLPPAQREYLHLARYLVLPAELALTWWVALRVRQFARGVSTADAALDVPERVRAALLHAMPYRATAEIFATELSLFWYALFSWRRRPHVPAGTRAFTGHRRSGTTAVIAALIAATVVEAIPMHFLLRAWSARLAWTLTALGALSLVWLLGLLRSVQLRPTLLAADSLVVRCGLRWTVEIPLDAIAAVDAARATLPRNSPGLLRATIAAQPDLLLTLNRPLRARGLYGTWRDVTRVALAVDDRAALAAALTSTCPT